MNNDSSTTCLLEPPKIGQNHAESTGLPRRGEEHVTDRQRRDRPLTTAWISDELAVYDFSQKLPEIWQGANRTVRRDLLDCVSLNRNLSDVSLVTQKRKPFDFLAERPFLNNSRGGEI